MATNIELSIALEALTKRIQALENIGAILNPEFFGQSVIDYLQANYPKLDLLGEAKPAIFDAETGAEIEALEKPLEVGDRVRVLSGDWGNSFGTIKAILDLDESPDHETVLAVVDLEAHLQDADIAIDLLAFDSRPETVEGA